MHLSSKQYGSEQGLSSVFRQWRATSHCRFLHGYALSIRLLFQAQALDGRNWVVDFGGLKPLKAALADTFDHKTLIAADDPELARFMRLHESGLIDLRVMPKGVGCEAFAQHIYELTESFLVMEYLPALEEMLIQPPRGLSLTSVGVSEHAGNGAIYAPMAPRLLTPGLPTNVDTPESQA